ncbi:MAG: hypothetical protein IJ334_04695 [Clostridia bacterium]|nr:hypothetical protein [Clostridia bacterium]
MRDWHELKEMLCKELEEYSRKGKMSAGDLETIHKLTDTIKNIDKIGMLEEDGGYSQAGGMHGGGRGMNRGGSSYNDGGYGGSSYRRQRRDSRGRYSREGGYSYDDGMEEVWEILEMMETGLPDEQREAIRRFRREMQK